jgi:hypothetical protein
MNILALLLSNKDSESINKFLDNILAFHRERASHLNASALIIELNNFRIRIGKGGWLVRSQAEKIRAKFIKLWKENDIDLSLTKRQLEQLNEMNVDSSLVKSIFSTT